MDDQVTIEALSDRLRQDGHRELADAVDYVAYSVEANDADVDAVDTDEIPLPPNVKMPFVIGMVFGTLLERRFPREDGREE